MLITKLSRCINIIGPQFHITIVYFCVINANSGGHYPKGIKTCVTNSGFPVFVPSLPSPTHALSHVSVVQKLAEQIHKGQVWDSLAMLAPLSDMCSDLPP